MKKSGCKVKGVKHYPTKTVEAFAGGGVFRGYGGRMGALPRGPAAGEETANMRERRGQVGQALRAGNGAAMDGSARNYRRW